MNNFIKDFVAPSATRAHMTQLIMPQHANSLAITFGGQVEDRLYYVTQLELELCFMLGRHPVEFCYLNLSGFTSGQNLRRSSLIKQSIRF